MINTLYKLKTIEDLDNYLNSLDINTARNELISEFDRLYDYKNIIEWNKLVRVCESLAIAGWGDREPLEAYAETWLNGAYYSYISNQYFEQKSCKRWSKRGDSYILDDQTDANNYGIKTLAFQRNPLPKCPFRITRIISNAQQSVKPIIEELTLLYDHLIKELRPQLYGSSFSYLVAIISFSNHDDEHKTVRFEYFHSENDISTDVKCKYYIRPRLEIGRLAKRKGELKLEITRYFTKAFGYLPLNEQKQIIATDLLEMVDILRMKLEKKKIKYDCDLLKSDIQQILDKWITTKNK